MARIKKRRVRWVSPDGTNVCGYRLYWSVEGEVGYESDYADVGEVTEIILPDHVPSFPRIAGNVELGVTAVDEVGNESDIAKVSTFLHMIAPGAPQELGVETLDEYHVELEESEQSQQMEV